MHIAAGTKIGNGPQQVAAFGDDVDLGRSGLTILRGPNGSGKTTLLKTLQGLIRFKGKPSLPPLPGALYLPDRLDWDDGLFFEDALDDLCLPCFRDGFRTLASELQLPSRSPYGTLSKGNRQKMSVVLVEAIARSRAVKWLLLDEPLSGLDPEAQAVLISFWRTQPGCRRLIASHGEAERFAPGLILRFEAGTIVPETARNEAQPARCDP